MNSGLLSRLRTEIAVLQAVWRHPNLPSGVRWLAGLVIAYALSPVDLIPDFIPLLGHLDDLLLLPAGVWLVWRLTPREILDECRHQVAAAHLPSSARGIQNAGLGTHQVLQEDLVCADISALTDDVT